MKKLYTVTLGILVLLLMAASASAESHSPVERYSEKGAGAQAYWSDYWSEGTYVDVFTDDGTTNLHFETWGYDDAGNYYDYYNWGTPISNEDFKINGLAKASLDIVQLPVTDWYTGAQTTVDVKVDWTGEGKVIKNFENYQSGPYTYRYNGELKEATATGSINGETIDAPFIDALLGKFKYTSIYKANKE
jgi:hypothetical protein